MKGSDKSLIYNLLKTASDGIYGYSSPDFPSEPPIFTDDDAKKPLTIDIITEKILKCTRCPLSRTKRNYVPGFGVINPPVLVIGEGPGETEDKEGLPFVGKAGLLLDKMLKAIDLDRNKNCYIANIVKCRPPENRNPNEEEVNACISFLQAQIGVLKPKMILLLGSVATKALLKTTSGVTSLHGKFFEYEGIPLMPTYHPSALLRDESLKRYAWEDLKLFRSKLTELAPNYSAQNNGD